VAALIVRQADLFRDDAALLDELAAGLDPTDARVVAAAPPALARRAVRRWLLGEHPPDRATVDRVLAVARGEAAACDVGGGRRVRRRHQRLTLL
jgi:tRNA(Ile)-lysidine synthase